ncbi:toxin-antitoxin system HicB family antitoxin [Candidatus Electronema sp. TJ]|uniref:toxin-antitoxin system HicB family antitoxin n=1 Tax=Candidatus Electronema sp. TJ TaxID=3401573 RepID=UPI003AA8C0DA
MGKANVLTLRIPSDLKERIGRIAEDQGVSVSQLAMYIFAKEIGKMEAGQQLGHCWKEHSVQELTADFDEVMAKVQRNPVPDWDRVE